MYSYTIFFGCVHEKKKDNFSTSLRVNNYNCTLSTFFRHPRGQFASTSLRSVHDTQETPEQKHGHFENPVSG